jgi:transposase
MLTVETIARIRREHAKGRSIRSIARALRVSRETVAKYVSSGETAPAYRRTTQPYP